MDVVAERSGASMVLLTLVAVLLASSVGGGILVWQEHEDRAAAVTVQERYAEVLAAARAESEAFINIRYDDAQASIDRVAEGATGELRDQYTSSSGEVVEVLQENESVMEGEVLYAGVVEVDGDSATVLTATAGTVANTETDNQPVERDLRLRLELVHEDGRWLTSALEVVR